MRRRFIKTTSSKLSEFDINNYITIEALEDNLTISARMTGSSYYGIDGIGWNEYVQLSKVSLNRGQTISFKGTNVKAEFYIDKPCNILGNGYSLLVGDDAVNITDISVFGGKILLFERCPIINVASNFLPATTLSYHCYGNMFANCASLTTAPELPATTLADSCYYSMFHRCTNLVNAPELHATTLVNTCYTSMFNGCTNLNYIKMLATDISAINCLSTWVKGVPTTGTFVKNPDATWEVYGDSGIPNGWTVKTE